MWGLKFITDQSIFMNWGYKIILVYVVFISGILFMVYKSSSQKTDLVTTDYYAKELQYQQKIDAMKNVTLLSDTVITEVSNQQLRIVFPQDFSGEKITGNAVLYCPSDENKDVSHSFSLKDEPLLLPLHAVNKIKYELQVSWQAKGKDYYFQKALLIK